MVKKKTKHSAKSAKKKSAKKKSAKKKSATKKSAKKSATKKSATRKSAKKSANAKKRAAKKRAAPKTSAPIVKQAAAPKPKKPALSPSQVAVEAKTVAELRVLLRANDQITTGSRDELVARVLSSLEHGTLPRCPQCGLGRIKETGVGNYYCPGGYDDDEYMKCNFVADTVVRPPWKYETPGLV